MITKQGSRGTVRRVMANRRWPRSSPVLRPVHQCLRPPSASSPPARDRECCAPEKTKARPSRRPHAPPVASLPRRHSTYVRDVVVPTSLPRAADRSSELPAFAGRRSRVHVRTRAHLVVASTPRLVAIRGGRTRTCDVPCRSTVLREQFVCELPVRRQDQHGPLAACSCADQPMQPCRSGAAPASGQRPCSQ